MPELFSDCPLIVVDKSVQRNIETSRTEVDHKHIDFARIDLAVALYCMMW